MYSQLVPGTVEIIRAKIRVFKQAGLSTEEEEARLAQLIGVPDINWLIGDWFPIGHKGPITVGVQICRIINKEARHGNNG